MAPGPGGTLFTSVPAPGGSVLVTLLDATGRVAEGWPVKLAGATSCGHLLAVEDGSVRILCTPADINQDLNQGIRGFAFDSRGKAMPGWPIDVYGYAVAGRMLDHDMTLFVSRSLGDIVEAGRPSHTVGLVKVRADGTVLEGVQEPRLEDWPGEQWAIGPDGIVYGSSIVSGLDEQSREKSRLTAIDRSGIRSGWPVSFDGLASGPAFGPDGRIFVTVGSLVRPESRGLAVDPATRSVSVSAALKTATAELGDTGGCGLGNPHTPLVAPDGTAFILDWAYHQTFALDPSLEPVPGWLNIAWTPFMRRDTRYVREDAYCPSLTHPAVGPDSTLYISQEARDGSAGGGLWTIGSDGRVRRGWPVELRRPGGEFWSVVVGSDGTVYALAIELESRDSSSATILAIAPDSTVLYTTTVIEP